MASYASILLTAPLPTSASASASPTNPMGNLSEIMAALQKITTAPDALLQIVESLRSDMEIPNKTGVGMRFAPNSSGITTPSRSFGGNNWRSGTSHTTSNVQKSSAFDTRTSSFMSASSPKSSSSTDSPRQPLGRYQTRFVTEGNIDDKILNTIIGNKLNSFTQLTYNDTRDFIYQIMDSGETEFVKDFIEKVFMKATVEELYCALFAKLIAEIAHRYPIMYDEMRRYHQEFLKIFENVEENERTIKDRQYRLGYGQFISELSCYNAIEKEQLLSMVSKVMEQVTILTKDENKTKTVEEFVDCLVRLTKSLSEKSPKFYASVKGDIKMRILDDVAQLINLSPRPPSLSVKGRFGLMDLRDLL